MGLGYFINQHVFAAVGVELRRVPAPTPFERKLKHFLHDAGVTCILDVGAHWGEFGGQLRRLGYTGRIVSFEPLPSSFAVLKRTVQGDPQWEARGDAITDQPGPLTLQVTKDTSCTSALPPSRFGRDVATGLEVTDTITVPAVTLDTVWDECVRGLPNPTVLLKTDTQGFDLHVLNSAEDRPLAGVLTEASLEPLYEGAPDLWVLLHEMERRRYTLLTLAPLGWPEDRVIELDCLFRRSC
jgi:FkbM family methyltransferase